MNGKPSFTDFELLSFSATNPFSGEYQNSIWCRRNASGTFTLWVQHWPSQAATTCRYKNIRTPEQFVHACQSCLEFADFGEAGVADAVRNGFRHIQGVDSKFDEALRTHLLREFEVDCYEPALTTGKPIESENLRKKHGASWTFIPFRPQT
jgi:hypothetical protein